MSDKNQEPKQDTNKQPKRKPRNPSKQPEEIYKPLTPTMLNKLTLLFSENNLFFRLFPGEDIHEKMGERINKDLEELGTIRDHRPVHMRFEAALGITNKSIATSMIEKKRAKQSVLDSICEHLKELREQRDPETKLLLYPVLQALPRVDKADFDLDEPEDPTKKSERVHAFALKLGYIRRDHDRVIDMPGYTPEYIRSHRDRFDTFERTRAGTVQTYYQQVIQTLDELMYMGRSPGHVQCYTRDEAHELVYDKESNFQGVYALYYTQPCADGTLGIFRSCLRISHYVMNSSEDSAVIRCKLNVPNINRSITTDIPPGGAFRFHYRGNLHTLHKHQYMAINLEQCVHSTEGAVDDMPDELEPDVFNLLVYAPSNNYPASTGIVSSYTQRLKTARNAGHKRQPYSSPCLLVRQYFNDIVPDSDRLDLDQLEYKFMQNKPSYFKSLQEFAAQEDDAIWLHRHPEIFLGPDYLLKDIVKHLPKTQEAKTALDALRKALLHSGYPGLLATRPSINRPKGFDKMLEELQLESLLE